jgi:hypothetical protein
MSAYITGYDKWSPSEKNYLCKNLINFIISFNQQKIEKRNIMCQPNTYIGELLGHKLTASDNCKNAFPLSADFVRLATSL